METIRRLLWIVCRPAELFRGHHALTLAAISASIALQLDTSHRSLSALTKRSATQTLGLSKDGSVAFKSPLSFSAPEVQHTSYSPDGRLQALFRSTPAKEGKEAKKVVEIWSLKDGVRLHELDVSKDHGDWYFDGMSSARSVPSS